VAELAGDVQRSRAIEGRFIDVTSTFQQTVHYIAVSSFNGQMYRSHTYITLTNLQEFRRQKTRMTGPCL